MRFMSNLVHARRNNAARCRVFQDGKERRCTAPFSLVGPHECSGGGADAGPANFQSLTQAESSVPPELRAMGSQGASARESPRAGDAAGSGDARAANGKAAADSRSDSLLKSVVNGADVSMEAGDPARAEGTVFRAFLR